MNHFYLVPKNLNKDVFKSLFGKLQKNGWNKLKNVERIFLSILHQCD